AQQKQLADEIYGRSALVTVRITDSATAEKIFHREDRITWTPSHEPIPCLILTFPSPKPMLPVRLSNSDEQPNLNIWIRGRVSPDPNPTAHLQATFYAGNL